MSDIVQQFLQFCGEVDIQKVIRLDHLSEVERRYLNRVYGAVLIGLLIGGIGCGSGSIIFRAGLLSPSTLSILATLVSIFSMYRLSATVTESSSSSGHKSTSVESSVYYSLSAFSTGLSLSGIVLYTAAISLQLLVSAVMMTSAIFGCLTLASLFAQRRSFLFLTSIISSIAFYTAMASLFGLFFPSNLLDMIISIGGLVTGIGYILQHTQTILEHSGRMNNITNGALMDAMTLFIDFVHIFINIVRIFLQRNDEDKNSRRQRRNQRKN